MRLLHITPAYLPAYRHGGPVISVHNLNKKLVELGVDITVYTTDINGKESLNVPLGKKVLIDGVKVFYFPSRGFFRFWSYSPRLHKEIKDTIKNFDIVHITSVFLAASTLGAHYAKKFKKPYIISPRGSFMVEPLNRKNSFIKKSYIAFVEKKGLENASALHFTCEAEKEEYQKLKLPCPRAVVIPNSVEMAEPGKDISSDDFRRKFNIPSGKKIILFLSRLTWKKGLDTLIPAIREVAKNEPNTLLVISGGDDEGYKKIVEKLINENNLKEHVIFTGMILGDDKIAALKTAEIFVLPSYSENFGMAVVEAMSFGLPVIITKNVGVSNFVKKYEAGIVINKSTSELKTAIEHLLTHKGQAKKMGECGKKLANAEFSMSAVANLFLAVFRDLTASR